MTLSTFIPDNVVVFFLVFLHASDSCNIVMLYVDNIAWRIWCKRFITVLNMFWSCKQNTFKNTELMQPDTLRRRIFPF